MHAGVRDQPLFPSDREERPVRDAGLQRVCPSVRRVRPCVEVGIKVDDRDGPVDGVQGAQDGQHDGVITPETVIRPSTETLSGPNGIVYVGRTTSRSGDGLHHHEPRIVERDFG